MTTRSGTSKLKCFFSIHQVIRWKNKQTRNATSNEHGAYPLYSLSFHACYCKISLLHLNKHRYLITEVYSLSYNWLWTNIKCSYLWLFFEWSKGNSCLSCCRSTWTWPEWMDRHVLQSRKWVQTIHAINWIYMRDQLVSSHTTNNFVNGLKG